MTEREKQERLRSLEEQRLELLAVMRRSDAHALKCYKLGIPYADAYPDEAAAYAAARQQYNDLEALTKATQEAEVTGEEMESQTTNPR